MNEMTQVLGIVAMEPKGEWDSETYYEKLNTVLYNDSTYMAKEGVVGEIPSTSSKWQLIGGGVRREDIVDNLDSNDATKMLSAKQGKILNEGKVQVFDTVALMKAANLKNGMTAQTVGYYSANDGGGATYKITSTESQTEYQEELDSGLYATLIVENGKISIDQLGAKKNDSTFDNSSIISLGIDLVHNKHRKLVLGAGTYYCNTTISKETVAECEIEGNYNSIIKYTGTGYFLSTPIANNMKFSNFKLEGNESNYGIWLGDTSISQVTLDNIRMDYLVRYLTIERPAYVYLYNCNFFFRTTCEYLVQIGKATARLGSELVTIDNCIFGGSQLLTSTGDILRVYQTSTLRVKDTDFANTLGHWIVFDNSSDGDMYDIQFRGCSFTRGKQGIEFNLTKNRFINNLIFEDCLVSLYGGWSDGETSIFKVNRTLGGIENSYIQNLSITNINNTYHPDYIYQDSSNGSYININVIRKPNIADKYKISGVQGLRTNATLTYGANISNSSFQNPLFRQLNACSISGNLTTSAQIGAYSTLVSGLWIPYNKANVNIIATDDSGNAYPLYIDNGVLKNRKTIPASTTIRIGALYYVDVNTI